MMKNKFKVILKIAMAVLIFFTALHFLFALLPYKELDFFLCRDFSTRVYDRQNNLVQITPLQNGLRREFVPGKEIPREVKKAFIKAEDKRFYFHCGFDFFSIVRATIQNLVYKKNVSGASTITMQLAKIINDNYYKAQNNLKIQSNRNLFTKVNETICALKLESRFSKSEILEMYLNAIPFGNNVEGVQSASRLYFCKDIKKLSNNELLILAQIPRRPKYYSPQKKYVYPFYMPHLVRYLDENNYFSLPENFQTNTYKSLKPYEVCLSADLNLQSYVQDCCKIAIEKSKESRIANISVLVMDVMTGDVLAWVGSNGFEDKENFGELDGIRFKTQPGSSIKPLLYALALDNKIVKPTDILPDVPMEFGIEKAYIPFNFNNQFNGPVSLRVCLASSLNIPAVYLLEKIGVNVFAKKLEELGFSEMQRIAQNAQLGLALGGGEISLQELLPAFSVFARDGKFIPLKYLAEKNIKNDNDKELQIYSRETSRIIADFLSQKNARTLGFGYYQTFETSYPSIFKTGTSNQFQNITALGATPRYAVGVWMGNFSGQTVVGKTGSSLPAYVAKQILDFLEYSDGKESLNFLQPESYKKIKVCELSGMKPNSFCPSSVYEYVKNQEPLKKCNWHTRENGQEIIQYPQIYQYWLTMQNKNSDIKKTKIFYEPDSLQIVYPRNDSVFYIDSKRENVQRLRLEVAGGIEEIIDVYIDDVFFTKKSRPYIVQIPLEKGKHSCKVICGNQENIVFYEVR